MNELDIFSAALEITDTEKRQAYLDEACGEDQAIRERLEKLLSNALGTSFLESPPPELECSPTIDQPIGEKPGNQIGPFKLLQQIGEGGMGVVFMAEQKQPVQRRVALKIIKPGMDSRQVVARFEAERQALAMMDHPNIAKVLDAGATENGRPYFVMELVNGLPVTKYCDEQHLTPNERLELFLPICQAIQHAHQKGIIHRDLKPGNILVALYDGKPVPKIIDFGVAKAMSQTLTEKTMFTALGQIVGTLEYMSPEQAERNQLDIDTRSDIYSLGVVLYELLTGETPFNRKRLRSAALDELLRIIREEEPSKPSTKVSNSQSLPSIAANRRTEPARLGNMIRGELDWIIMKAMEKDRDRRYETANGLGKDIERHLADEPVLAGPPSAAYKMRKFARRHRALIASAALIAAALVGGAGLATWQALRATSAEQVAQDRLVEVDAARAQAQQRLDEVNRANELLSAVLETLDPAELTDEASEHSLEEIMSERFVVALERLESASISDPLILADVRHRLARSLRLVKRYDRAQPLVEQALATRTAELGRDHGDTLNSLGLLAWCFYGRREFVRAAELHQERLNLMIATLGPDHHHTHDAWRDLMWVWKHPEEFRERRLELATETVTRMQDTLGPVHEMTVNAQSWLAKVLLDQGQGQQAIDLLTETLDRQIAARGRKHASTLEAMSALAGHYRWNTHLQNLEKALQLNVGALEIATELFGPHASRTYDHMNNLADTYRRLGKIEEFMSLTEEAFEGRRQVSRDPPSSWELDSLAGAYEAAGMLEKACPLRERALRLYVSRAAPTKRIIYRFLGALVGNYVRAGRFDDAVLVAKEYGSRAEVMSYLFLEIGAAYIRAADWASYEAHCDAMVTRFADTKDAEAADQTIKLCCLRPDTVALDRLPRDTLLATIESDTTATQFLPWCYASQALLAYRDGDAAAAVVSARQSLALAEKNLSSNLHDLVAALSHSVLALAQGALGDRDAAFVALEAASSTLARLASPEQRDTVFARTLFDEARAELEGSQD